VITINLDRAKEIKKESLRQERKPLLEAQDVLYMRAQEAGTDTTAIVAEKQRLRDITMLVDTAASVEDLKAISIESD
jgi:chemotaxis signal transduction protein